MRVCRQSVCVCVWVGERVFWPVGGPPVTVTVSDRYHCQHVRGFPDEAVLPQTLNHKNSYQKSTAALVRRRSQLHSPNRLITQWRCCTDAASLAGDMSTCQSYTSPLVCSDGRCADGALHNSVEAAAQAGTAIRAYFPKHCPVSVHTARHVILQLRLCPGWAEGWSDSSGIAHLLLLLHCNCSGQVSSCRPAAAPLQTRRSSRAASVVAQATLKALIFDCDGAYMPGGQEAADTHTQPTGAVSDRA
jgi:hypothetical protein